MTVLRNLFIAGIVMVLSGCTSPSLKKYSSTEPVLNIEEYFNGPVKAWGIVQNWRGDVTRRFDVDMVGKWSGNTGTLEEDFTYYDGKKQQRTWIIRKLPDNRYEGTAADIKGAATGEGNGHAVRWKYEMNLEVDGKTYLVTFDDWMFLMNDGILINRSYIKKFGITVAELTIVMQKQDGSKNK
jgi:hypothetical protein